MISLADHQILPHPSNLRPTVEVREEGESVLEHASRGAAELLLHALRCFGSPCLALGRALGKFVTVIISPSLTAQRNTVTQRSHPGSVQTRRSERSVHARARRAVAHLEDLHSIYPQDSLSSQTLACMTTRRIL
jgi:hypothetical protein